MTNRQLIKVILRNLPYFHRFLASRTGGTNSALYCYSVWMKHLNQLYENNIAIDLKTVAELGPGDSIGTGLTALLSGAEKYLALDVVDFSNVARDLEIFEELLILFKSKAQPGYGIKYPTHLFNDSHLEMALDETRIERIRQSIISNSNNDMIIKFIPWINKDIAQINSVDFIFSQAVMEHVENISETYKQMSFWLKPGGVISHQIDYWSHDTAKKWNGHWSYSDELWKIIKGNYSSLFINRHPHSDHIIEMQKHCFEIVSEKKSLSYSGLSKKELAKKFKNMTDEDLLTTSALIQARKVV
ncbi:MAG: methyltransferase domain-containing protein [Bacteroidota bacterium]|nr:methyltransferase domain-containing protein [Bacteroidota bacterium]